MVISSFSLQLFDHFTKPRMNIGHFFFTVSFIERFWLQVYSVVVGSCFNVLGTWAPVFRGCPLMALLTRSLVPGSWAS